MASEQDEEDDYLSMAFEDVAPAKNESSLQRTARLKREASERGRVLSKVERRRKEEEEREKTLKTELDPSNKGAQMMAKMGFRGGGLGKTVGARTRPIELNIKDDRGGIGMESEKKRKVREAAEALEIREKRIRLSAEEYRERYRLEEREKRHEGQMWSAMRVLDDLETDEGANTSAAADDWKAADTLERRKAVLPLRSVNLLRRSLVKQRREKEAARRTRDELAQSLSRRTDYNDQNLNLGEDEDLDKDDKLALGTEVEEEVDESDAELDEFEALSCSERRDRILAYLRLKYDYCFWCKYRYPDETMDGCPGISEDEHG